MSRAYSYTLRQSHTLTPSRLYLMAIYQRHADSVRQGLSSSAARVAAHVAGGLSRESAVLCVGARNARKEFAS